MCDVVINASRCVLSEEVQHIRLNIIRRIPGVHLCIRTVIIPECRRTFVSIRNSTTIGVGIAPICSDLLLNGVRYSVSIAIQRIHVVVGIILWIRTIEILLKVGYSTIISVSIIPQSSVVILCHIASTNAEHQWTAGIILEPIVQTIAIEISEIVAWFHRVSSVDYFVEVADTISIRVSHVREGDETPRS